MPPYYPKAKNDLQKLKINKDKPAVSMIEKDAPIVDSPVSIDFEEMNPGGPPQDNLPGVVHPKGHGLCENPSCKQCGRELGIYPADVLPNNDNLSSGL